VDLFILSANESIIKYFKNYLVEDHSVDGNIYFFKVPPENYLQAAEFLKEQGFQRLLTVSAVDWLDKERFEVSFLTHNMTTNIYVKVAAEILRSDPKIPSISAVWLNAFMHENEIWELFDINFEGNDHLQPLFLETKPASAPFRKDVNWREELTHS